MLHKIGEGEERGGRRIKEETTFDSFSHSNISQLNVALNLMTKIILALFTFTREHTELSSLKISKMQYLILICFIQCQIFSLN
jgi:hypothetical protein